MIIHKCDKCGKTAEQKRGEVSALPSNWKPIQFSAGYSGKLKKFEVCETCAIALELSGDWKENAATIGDQLIEIITEIVDERMEP